MPTYEYVCLECAKKTEVQASISEKEKGLNLKCPRCGSKKMVQLFGSFMLKSSSKGNSNPPICGPQAGPGCCGQL